LFECMDPVELGYFGWEIIDDCIADEGMVLYWMLSCPETYTYDAQYAAGCLAALQSANCAALETGEGLEVCNDAIYCEEVEPS